MFDVVQCVEWVFAVVYDVELRFKGMMSLPLLFLFIDL